MIDFLKRLFGQSGSSATAKERLRLVLMTDHLELAPEIIDGMKRDLVDVISRYVEVDRDRIEVTFEQQDRALAMLANIPILAVNRPTANGTLPKPTDSAPQPSPVAAPEPAANGVPEIALPIAESEESANVQKAPPTRKRRRRKKAQDLAPLSP